MSPEPLSTTPPSKDRRSKSEHELLQEALGMGTSPELRAAVGNTEGRLRFERATAEDTATATRDPETVHPLSLPVDDAEETSMSSVPTTPATRDHVIVPSLVIHPGTSTIVGVHPTCTQPSAARAEGGLSRTRKQRSDTKRPHDRDLNSRYRRPRVLPRAGIKSSMYVIESGTQDTRAEQSSEPESGCGSSGWQFWPLDDPLEEFVPASIGESLTLSGAQASSSNAGDVGGTPSNAEMYAFGAAPAKGN